MNSPDKPIWIISIYAVLIFLEAINKEHLQDH